MRGSGRLTPGRLHYSHLDPFSSRVHRRSYENSLHQSVFQCTIAKANTHPVFSLFLHIVGFLLFSLRFFICDANEFYSDGRRKPNRLHGLGCREVRVSGQKSCCWQKSARTPISLLLIDPIFPFHREVRGYLVRADQILQ